MTPPGFPPLFRGREAAGADEPMPLAVAKARAGCDPGLVTYRLEQARMKAAIVFAPEVPLRDAVTAFPVCGIGFQNALGALAPPEVAVQLGWMGGIYVNGGLCGKIEMAADDVGPEDVPDWLVVGFELALWPESEETGHTPDVTALFAEGCAEVDPMVLLEAWVRHVLVWLNGWAEDGRARIHREWAGLAHGVGESIDLDGTTGRFIGIDEDFGLILDTDDGPCLVPLTRRLEIPR